MSNSHSSLDYHQYLQFMSIYRLGVRMRSRQYTFTRRNNQSVTHSVGITVTNVSSRDSQAATELIDDQEEDAILFEHFKIRIHHVADGINNPTETEEICAICHAEFEDEESIGILGCGHEYHTGCIKQWLLSSFCFALKT
ncbi:hypothetical protein AABB24_039619 [Solanum stoloniferum]|uniref:RING-type E3 ubiquitin transferase n=1 Tax=Solanum stoloniferum TaxID=62892 RepID=A0ABD2QRG8_9SOLN